MKYQLAKYVIYLSELDQQMCKYINSQSEVEIPEKLTNATLRTSKEPERMFAEIDIGTNQENEFIWTLEKLALEKLVKQMTGGKATDSSTPAGMTYLGQFLTHEIVVDTNQDRAKNSPREGATPHLNLDSVYFSEEYLKKNEDKNILKDGCFQFTDIAGSDQRKDLLRVEKGKENQGAAIIPEPRNDENKIIAQFHVLVQQLHNVAVHICKDNGLKKPEDNYKSAKAFTTLVMQRTIIEDYLWTILDPRIYELFFVRNNSYFYSDTDLEDFSIPLEFSNAAFRFGHTMIRAMYKFNCSSDKSLKNILAPNEPITKADVIDWDNFFVLPGSKALPQNANKIDLNFASEFQAREPLKDSDQLSTNQNDNDDFRKSIIQQLIIKDIEASQHLSSGTDYLNQMLDKGSLFSDLGIMGGKEYVALLESGMERTVLKSFLDEGLLSPTKSPFWIYLLLESSVFPFSNFIARKDSLSQARDPSYSLPAAVPERLGPIASLVIAEVVKASIRSAEINMFQSMDKISEKHCLPGCLRAIYQDWVTDHSHIKMGDIINFINSNFGENHVK